MNNLNSNDLCKKMNMVMDKIYFDELSNKEKTIAIDKMLCTYTTKKIQGEMEDDIKFDNFKESILYVSSLMENSYEKDEFVNNYTLFLIKLLSKNQNASISWQYDKYEDDISFRHQLCTNKIDAIITNEKSDSIEVLFKIYNLYNKSLNEKNVYSDFNNIICK